MATVRYVTMSINEACNSSPSVSMIPILSAQTCFIPGSAGMHEDHAVVKV